MKRNLKSALLGVALLASVSGAFASQISSVLSGKKFVNYNWVQLNRSGEVIPGSAMSTTTDSNPYLSDCGGVSDDLCARGTIQGQSTANVFYNYTD